jgi:hypothetical protein
MTDDCCFEHFGTYLGSYKPTSKDLLQDTTFTSLKNGQSNMNNSSKNRLGTKSTKEALAGQQLQNATDNVVKKATMAFRKRPLEHIESLGRLQAYLEEAKRQNSSLAYQVDKDEDNMLQRAMVLFPGSASHLHYCFNVVGIDSAFMDAVMLDGIQEAALNLVYGTEGIDRDGRQVKVPTEDIT